MKKTIPFCMLLLVAAGQVRSAERYEEMDYGPFLCATYIASVPSGNVAYRGVAVPFELPLAEGMMPEGPIGGGSITRVNNKGKVEATADAELYRSQRSGFKGYKLNVPPGTYKVTLHFCDTTEKAKGKRVFDVLLQDQPAVVGLDIVDRVGANKALVVPLDNIEVKPNQQFVLTFKSQKGDPCLSALAIEGPAFTRKIRCGVTAFKDFAADWPAVYDADLFARKGGAIFDTEMLRYMAVWTGGFLKLDGVAFTGAHGPNPSPLGTMLVTTKPTPGWAHGGSLKDPRELAYGPLPRDWGRFKGLFRHDNGVVFKYAIGATEVLDAPSFETHEGQRFFCRTLNVLPTADPLTVVIADLDNPQSIKEITKDSIAAQRGKDEVLIALKGGLPGTELAVVEGSRIVLKLPASKSANRVKVAHWSAGEAEAGKARAGAGLVAAAANLTPLTTGGKARFPQTAVTKGIRGADQGAYVLDKITPPFENPYKSWMRFGGLDFFADGRAAITTWSGDVWIVSGLDDKLEKVTWKRFAAGLFQPLGLKIVGDQIYVLCRDGIIRLHDLNGDGEADYYECINNEFLVTKNFHEFIFDLQTDADGNFYFIKGGPVKPGGSGWDTITPSHGSLFKVSKDGMKLDIIARGFRAPNGMGIGPNGEITTGDNEGTWTPMCPINWIKPGGFYGVPDFSLLKPLPTVRPNPLCWMPKDVDNSSGGQVWITGKDFGPLSGQLLHLSYGTCKLFNVLKEEVGGQMQGGVVPLPLKFDTGIMRARFVEKQNALYLAGLRGWQTTATKDAGFYRVRYTGQAADLPVGLHVEPGAIKLSFSDPLDRKYAEDAESYNLQRWNYRWTQAYGSPHFKVSNPKQQGHDDVEVESASLSPDGKTVTLKIADLHPVMQMKIAYQLKGADGSLIKNAIHHTINVVGDQRGEVHVGEYRIVQKK
jgi:glucose/arabinose dehydrogenase